jgi:hypothetical protein
VDELALALRLQAFLAVKVRQAPEEGDPPVCCYQAARPVSDVLHGRPAFEQDKHAFFINAISIC